jgi:hypothetical protein
LSVSTFHLPDEERGAKSLLHSQGLLLALYLLSWGMAALAVTNPMTVEQVTLSFHGQIQVTLEQICPIFG